jgi:hypothetical protein
VRSSYSVPPWARRSNVRGNVLAWVFATGLLATSTAAIADVKIVSVSAPPDNALKSVSLSDFGVDVAYKIPQDAVLHLWVEEYPSGSGCGGSDHHTNGGADVQLGAGEAIRHVVVLWYGAANGGSYGGGFLQIGARIDGDGMDQTETCYRFGSELQ